MKCINYLISGKVQRVWFRAETQKIAKQLGVKGWVKNLKDNRVEVLAQGTDEQLQQFREWLHHGPEKAEVEKVEAYESECLTDFEEFKITF